MQTLVHSISQNETSRQWFQAFIVTVVIVQSVCLENAICSALEIHRHVQSIHVLVAFCAYIGISFTINIGLLYAALMYCTRRTWHDDNFTVDAKKTTDLPDLTADEIIRYAFPNTTGR